MEESVHWLFGGYNSRTRFCRAEHRPSSSKWLFMQTRTTNSHAQVSNLYRNYVLVMLILVYIFNFVDRQLLVILQESIKKELQLSDTQLGLLSGFTFAIFINLSWGW